MKKYIILTTAITLFSSALLAAGSHSGGHDGHDMSKMGMGAHWASPKDAMMQENPIHSNAASIAKGLTIYQKNCVTCHGVNADGKGPTAAYLTPKPTNLKAMSGMHPDGDFAWKIANGRGPMPAWKGTLSENDIWNTVNFIQSLKGTQKPKGGHHDGGHKNHHQ